MTARGDRPGDVVVRGLGKAYPTAGGDHWALRDVSFDLPRGGGLALIGENGAGKSTLLDVIAGTARATSGEVRVGGPVAALLELGAGFFSGLSGRENTVAFLRLAGLSGGEARARAAEVEEFAELGEFFQQPVRTYSAGMAVRLGFAVASAVAAPVLVVDEVIAVGDGYFQRKCIDRLRALRATGHTLVVASHDLHALRGLCDQALWLRGGRVEQGGPAGEVIALYEQHLRRRSATLDGGAPARHGTGEVRIVDVRLEDGEGQARTAFATGGTLRVVVHFETTRPLDSPVMGVALFRDDGVYCYGPNTRFDGIPVGTVDGRQVLTAEFPRLPLLAGRYEVSVSFYDRDHVYAYAWHHRMYPFRVESDRPDHGVVRLEHRFALAPATGETEA